MSTTKAPKKIKKPVRGSNIDGTAIVNLGGEDRVIRYSLLAFEMIEEESGVNVFDMFEQMGGGEDEDGEKKRPNFKHITTLLWGGMASEDPSLSREDVARMIDIGNLTEVTKAMTAAFSRSNNGKQYVKDDEAEDDDADEAEEEKN